MKKILIWVLAGAFLVSCAAPQAVATTVNTPLPESTSTSQPTNTSEPATPIPTLTPMPTQTPLLPVSICSEGWRRLEGRGVDMCLPVSWEGGSDERLNTGIAKLKNMGANGERMASILESMRSSIIFWAFDTEVSSVATNVNIGNDPASLPVSQFMDGECQQLPVYYQQQLNGTAGCLETSVVAVGNFKDVGRVVIEESISGVEMKAIQYIIKQGSYFWEVTFTTDTSRYSESFTIFETAISTLNINQQ